MSALPFPYEGPPEWRDRIVAALHRVVDPEVALDIVAVGLVYGVEVRGDDVMVRVTMTSAACPVADVILDDIAFELEQALPERFTARPELVWEPPWSPERMGASARELMGW